MLKDRDNQQMQIEYISTVLWSIGRMLGGSDYAIPMYDDVIHPKPQDKRNTHQIVGGLVEKLRKGVSDSGGNGIV